MLKLVPPYELTAHLDSYSGQWVVTPPFTGGPHSWAVHKQYNYLAMEAVAKAKMEAEARYR